MKRDHAGGQLGEKLREALRESGLSLNEIGKRCGVDRGILSRFARGERELSLKSAGGLASALGIEVEVASHSPKTSVMDGGQAQFFPDRASVLLEQKLASARSIIQILTTTMTTDGSLSYLSSIKTALDRAKEDERGLKVTILASDPDNPFLEARALQLSVSLRDYRETLKDALKMIGLVFKGKPNCRLLTYCDFPIQLWYRIDDMIYVSIPSIGHQSRENCVFGINIDAASVSKTFLDHFKALEEKAEEYSPEGDYEGGKGGDKRRRSRRSE